MGQVVSGKRVNPPAKMLTFLPPGVLLGISGGGVPIPDKNGQSLYPFSDQSSALTLRLWGGAYLNGLCRGVKPPGVFARPKNSGARASSDCLH